MHMEDAFIQNDLLCIECIQYPMHSLGIKPMNGILSELQQCKPDGFLLIFFLLLRAHLCYAAHELWCILAFYDYNHDEAVCPPSAHMIMKRICAEID